MTLATSSSPSERVWAKGGGSVGGEVGGRENGDGPRLGECGRRVRGGGRAERRTPACLAADTDACAATHPPTHPPRAVAKEFKGKDIEKGIAVPTCLSINQ